MNGERKNERAKGLLTPEEVKQFRKSDFYRESLEQYVGDTVVIDVPYYEFKPYKEDKDKACLRDAKVIKIGGQNLDGETLIEIEHIWVAVGKTSTAKIDSRKPLRVTGTLYEYPKRCGNCVVRNIGLHVRHIAQNMF